MSSPKGVAEIRLRLDSVDLSESEEDLLLQTLEAYECWDSYLLVMGRRLKNSGRRHLNDYIMLARVQNRCLGDIKEAAASSAELIVHMGLDYETFREDVMPKVVAEGDFGAEAAILEAVYSKLVKQECRVACMERLCLIYEKKKYNEPMINTSYQRLISIDDRNIKALRFFKVAYTQANNWEEVEKILKALHLSVRHEGDKFRYAQERATVHLYQLNNPKKSLEIIEKYCSKSHLDTSAIQFEAYFRLSNLEGCISILREQLSKVHSEFDQAILHFKIGELERQRGHSKEAKARFLECLALRPSFLEAIEKLVTLSLNAKDWRGAIDFLGQMQLKVSSLDLRARLEDAKKRLLDGIVSAS